MDLAGAYDEMSTESILWSVASRVGARTVRASHRPHVFRRNISRSFFYWSAKYTIL